MSIKKFITEGVDGVVTHIRSSVIGQLVADKRRDEHGVVVDQHGIYLTPIAVTVIRVLLSILLGTLGAIILIIIGGSFGILGFGDIFILTMLIGALVYWGSDGRGAVPNDHVGVVEFLGARHKVYLTEGLYTWFPTFLGFGINETPLPGAKNLLAGEQGEEQGFVFTAVREGAVWNNRDDAKNTKVSVASSSGSDVFFRTVLRYIVTEPLLWASVINPENQLFEQVRESLRNAAKCFRGIDIAASGPLISSLVVGKRALVVYTTEMSRDFLEYSIVRDKSGRPLYKCDISNTIDQTEYMKVVSDFRTLVEKNGDPKMLAVAARDENQEVVVVEIQVTDGALDALVTSLGINVLKLILSDIDVSKEETEAANAAASEGLQRRAQMASAATARDAAIVRKEAKEKGASDVDILLSALQDGLTGININHISGGNPSIGQAIAAHGGKVK